MKYKPICFWNPFFKAKFFDIRETVNMLADTDITVISHYQLIISPTLIRWSCSDIRCSEECGVLVFLPTQHFQHHGQLSWKPLRWLTFTQILMINKSTSVHSGLCKLHFALLFFVRIIPKMSRNERQRDDFLGRCCVRPTELRLRWSAVGCNTTCTET